MTKIYKCILILLPILLTACATQAPFSTDATTWLPTVSREWPRPETSVAPLGTNIAHQQLNQQSPIQIQEQLWDFLDSLEWMTSGPSKISVAGARAVFTPDTTAPTAVADERVHLHPDYDGSLHISLPDTSWTDLITQYGRGEAHPRNPTTVLLYGPRNQEELDIIQDIITAVYELHQIP